MLLFGGEFHLKTALFDNRQRRKPSKGGKKKIGDCHRRLNRGS